MFHSPPADVGSHNPLPFDAEKVYVLAQKVYVIAEKV